MFITQNLSQTREYMKFIFTSFCLLASFYLNAQRCIISEYSNRANARPFAGGVSPQSGRDTLADEVIVIPVVIHILYNTNDQNISNQQVLSQIEALNKDYRRLNDDASNTPDPFKNVAADARIVFCLAKVDPAGKPTSGIIRKYTKETTFLADDAVKFSESGGDDAWDASKYLNIWVCNLFGRTLGYGVLPGSPAERDGVVLKYNVFGTVGNLTAPYNKGRTATHEIGHWLGLRHLWGDANCGDDGIADTPPQQAANSYCQTFPHLSSCSINAFGDMFMNFMDFSDDACMNMFTQGQKIAMRSLFAKGNAKNSFLNSSVCEGSEPEGGPLPDVEEMNDSPFINAYPNPFANEITIDSKNGFAIPGKVIKIYSANGKLLLMQAIQSQKTTLHLNHLPSGIYFLRIDGAKKPLFRKLIKS